MPKGKGKKTNDKFIITADSDIIEKDDNSEYGIVTKNMGGRFMVKLNMSNKEIVAKVKGSLKKGSRRKKNWIDIGTFVLVGLRDFQDDMADIIHVYKIQDIRKLRKKGVLIEESNVSTENPEQEQEDETGFVFEEI